MIYDPRRAALKLKRRIFESMAPEQQRAYLLDVPLQSSGQSVSDRRSL